MLKTYTLTPPTYSIASLKDALYGIYTYCTHTIYERLGIDRVDIEISFYPSKDNPSGISLVVNSPEFAQTEILLLHKDTFEITLEYTNNVPRIYNIKKIPVMDSNITYISSNDKPINPDIVDVLYENRDTVKCAKYIKLLQFDNHSPREVAEDLSKNIHDVLGYDVNPIINVELNEYNTHIKSISVEIKYKPIDMIHADSERIYVSASKVELSCNDSLYIEYHSVGGGYMSILNINSIEE